MEPAPPPPPLLPPALPTPPSHTAAQIRSKPPALPPRTVMRKRGGYLTGCRLRAKRGVIHSSIRHARGFAAAIAAVVDHVLNHHTRQITSPLRIADVQRWHTQVPSESTTACPIRHPAPRHVAVTPAAPPNTLQVHDRDSALQLPSGMLDPGNYGHSINTGWQVRSQI